MKHFNIACGVVIILYLIISCNSKPYNVCVSSPKFHVITSINQKKFPLNEKTLKKIDFLNLPVGDGRDTCLLPPKNHEEYLLVATFYEYQDDYSVIKLIGYSHQYRLEIRYAGCRSWKYSFIIYINNKRYLLDNDKEENQRIYDKVISKIPIKEEQKSLSHYRENILHNYYCGWGF